tara:strand:+ start:359 stop:508 length:150 start_codon:yes stop_codon:yes gene_type:complete
MKSINKVAQIDLPLSRTVLIVLFIVVLLFILIWYGTLNDKSINIFKAFF